MRAIDNPFAVHRMLQVRFRPQECSWDELTARLASMNYRATIVGPKGSGKTTLLEDLGVRLEALGFDCIFSRADVDDVWKQRALSPREVLLVDSAEWLSRMQWWRLKRLTRRGGGLIVTAHLPTRLPTVINTSTSPELLTNLLHELGQSREDHVAERLFAKHQGNMREAMRELYDVCST
jgi:hypothetical protein